MSDQVIIKHRNISEQTETRESRGIALMPKDSMKQKRKKQPELLLALELMS